MAFQSGCAISWGVFCCVRFGVVFVFRLRTPPGLALMHSLPWLCHRTFKKKGKKRKRRTDKESERERERVGGLGEGESFHGVQICTACVHSSTEVEKKQASKTSKIIIMLPQQVSGALQTRCSTCRPQL